MSSTPSHRPRKRTHLPQQSASSPPSSSITSLLSQPPPDLLPSAAPDLLRLALVAAVAILVAASCSYFASLYNRLPTPFCNSDLDDFSVESCVPCPSNGQCQEGILECNQGYKKYGKTCVEDVHVDLTLNRLLERVENQLCKAYVEAVCDGSGTVWVPEDELRDTLDGFAWAEISRLDNVAYDYVMERAMKKIYELYEARLNDKLGTKELRCPAPLAENYKPVFCRIQQWIAEHSLILMSVCALFGGCTIFLLRICRRLYLSRRAVEIYDEVCDVLEENASKDGETWVVASRLRDHVLSPLERRDQQLWKKVVELMTEDSRMECYPKLVKGESKEVWEWQVEGSLSSSRKKKKSEPIHPNSSADANISDRKERSSPFGAKALFK